LKVIDQSDFADKLALAKVCADVTSSTRPPENLIMQIDVEGDDELDVDDDVLVEFRDDAAKGVGSFKILVSPSTQYDPPIPDELEWESGFWTNELVRHGGIDIMCEGIAMHELDLTALVLEYERIEKGRDAFNNEAAMLVNMDIQVLEAELHTKKQRMDGILEDIEEAEEEQERLETEKAEVEQRLEALHERLDFYDNQIESWKGRAGASTVGSVTGSVRGSVASDGRGSVSAAQRMQNAAKRARSSQEGSQACMLQ